jgi:cation:H+ antiporter
VKISRLFGLSSLFIGLILVAFGTSAPEAGVGIIAALKDQKQIALGNIVGSNISNIGLILGICAMLGSLKVEKSIFKRELPMMIISGVLLYILSLDRIISRLDGIIFLGCFVIFFFLSYKGARTPSQLKEVEDLPLRKLLQNTRSRLVIFTVIAVSIAGVVWGADLMVKSGVALAKIFGISSWIIGVTVFAVGTSLPELAASLTAYFKKLPSISIGNIVGSNIFNVFFVLGIVALIRPIEIHPSILSFELPVMILFSFILLIFMRTGYRINRWEGVGLFLAYAAFIFFLFRF